MVFTESGIYMLMTVLKGELAISQSKILIRTFKQMKDYIQTTQILSVPQEIVQLSLQVSENTKEISDIKEKMLTKDDLTKVKKFSFALNLTSVKIKASTSRAKALSQRMTL